MWSEVEWRRCCASADLERATELSHDLRRLLRRGSALLLEEVPLPTQHHAAVSGISSVQSGSHDSFDKLASPFSLLMLFAVVKSTC